MVHKVFKRSISWLLIFIMAICMMPLNVLAEGTDASTDKTITIKTYPENITLKNIACIYQVSNMKNVNENKTNSNLVQASIPKGKINLSNGFSTTYFKLFADFSEIGNNDSGLVFKGVTINDDTYTSKDYKYNNKIIKTSQGLKEGLFGGDSPKVSSNLEPLQQITPNLCLDKNQGFTFNIQVKGKQELTLNEDIIIVLVFAEPDRDKKYEAKVETDSSNNGTANATYIGVGKDDKSAQHFEDKWKLEATPVDNMQFSHWTYVSSQKKETTGDSISSDSGADKAKDNAPAVVLKETTGEGIRSDSGADKAKDNAPTVVLKETTGDSITSDSGEEKLYDNPLSVVLDESTGNRIYTAHFKPVDLELQQGGGLLNKDVVIGGRESIKIPYFLPNRITTGNLNVEYKVYHGKGTQGTQLCKGNTKIDGNTGEQHIYATIDPLPANIKDQQFITVKARLSDNNGQRPWHTQSYDISSNNYIIPEIDKTFNYLTTTKEGAITGAYQDAGPSITGGTAYIDEKTGKLQLFLTSMKGVFTWDSSGAKDLTLMNIEPGLKEKMFGETGLGGIYAVGVTESEKLLGMVATNEHINGERSSYLCTYDCIKKEWKRIENSNFINKELEDSNRRCYASLIFDANDIWSDNEYWNGTKWENKDKNFNSFYKLNCHLGFGATNDGLYKITNKGASEKISFAELDNKQCFIQSGNPSGKLIVQVYDSKFYLVDITANTCIEIPSGNKYMGFGYNDTLYKAEEGRGYQGATGYCESKMFRFDTSSNEWIQLEIPEFMDANDDRSVLDTKIRPSYISNIMHPIPEISIFVSSSNNIGGAIYAQYDQTEHTITFDPLGGTCNKTSVNGKLRDKIQLPVPSKDGCQFGGWYYSPNCLGQEFTANDTMPAKNITLYAKWCSAGDDKYAADREKAKKSLKENLQKCDQSEYTEENWNKLMNAYEKGLYEISTTKPTDHLAKEIYAALNVAVSAMGDIPTVVVKKVNICVSMDANTLGLGYIIKPTIVTTDKNTKASKIITDLLAENGYKWKNTGTIADSFYLSQVEPVDQKKAVVADYILKQPNVEISEDDKNDDMLGEFDYFRMSGWMYSIGDKNKNKYPKFPGVGAAGWRMTDGEVMRWQFTVYGYGADLNADNESFGGTSIVPNLGNKSELTWKVGELRGKYRDEVLEANEVYKEAIKVLTNPESDQSKVDSALQKLCATYAGQDSEKPSKPSTGSSGGGSSSVPADKSIDSNSSKVLKEVKATIDSEGKATASVDAKDLSASLNKAVQAIKDSKKNVKPEVKIDVKVDSSKAKSVQMSMDKSSITELSKNEAILIVNTPLAAFAFDEKSIETIGSKAKGSEVRFDAVKTDADNVIKSLEALKSISEAKKSEILNAVGKRPVFDLSIMSDKEKVTSFEKGMVKVSLPYILASGENASNLKVVYIADDGSMKDIKSSYNSNSKALEFETGHFSYYAIAYKTDAKKDMQFSDVKAGDWYADSIMSLVGKGIIKGKTTNTFEPNSNITRAEFAQLLYGLAKSKSYVGVSGTPNVFSDVKAGQWYAEAVNWAYANGVVKGTSETTFSPNSNISRQDMAVMIQNYVEKVEKKALKEKNAKADFADNGKISKYANDAVSLMQRAGVINGIKNADNTYNFEPKNNATRAQAAKMIYEII